MAQLAARKVQTRTPPARRTAAKKSKPAEATRSRTKANLNSKFTGTLSEMA